MQRRVAPTQTQLGEFMNAWLDVTQFGAKVPRFSPEIIEKADVSPFAKSAALTVYDDLTTNMSKVKYLAK